MKSTAYSLKQNLDPTSNKVKLAIIFTAIPDTCAGTVTASLAAIAIAMPHVRPTLIQMIVSISPIFASVVSAIYAFGAMRVKKKTLLAIGCITFFVGGLGPIFCNSIYPILFFRALVGVSAGIMMPITTDLICEFYEGRTQTKLLGYASMLTFIGTVLYQTVGGFLGNINWRYCFLATIIGAPFFIYSFIFFPETNGEVTPVEHETKAEDSAEKIHMTLYGWLMEIFTILRELFFFIFLSTASFVMVGEGLATTAQAGITVSMFAVGGVIIGAVFERFDRIAGRYTLPIGYGLIMAGLLLFQISHHYTLFNAAGLLIGIGYGIATPVSFSILAHVLPNQKSRTLGISLNIFAKGIGAFFSPIIFGLVHQITGTTQGRLTFNIGWICMLITSILAVFFVMKVYPKKPAGKA